MKKLLLSMYIWFITILGFAQSIIPCDSVELWDNGNLENSNMSNYIFNPNNYYNKREINYNTAWRTIAWQNWQSVCYPGSGIIGGTFVAESRLDADGDTAGHYLYVDPRNGYGDVYQIRQAINVSPYTYYRFTAKVTTMTEFNMQQKNLESPQIGLSINNVRITPILNLGSIDNCVDAYTGKWQDISGIWYSDTNSVAIANVFALDPYIGGHDFAVDNISFKCSKSMDISNVQSIINLSVFPNPSNKWVQIESLNRDVLEYQKVIIFNNLGKEIEVIDNINSNEKIDISNYRKGIYTIHITLQGYIYFLKLLVD